MSDKKSCDGIINLNTPISSEQRRGFQPPYYTVYKYKCPKCGYPVTVRAGAFRGRTPEPGVGGIRCGNNLAVKEEEVR
jgi:hypothetical protein